MGRLHSNPGAHLEPVHEEAPGDEALRDALVDASRGADPAAGVAWSRLDLAVLVADRRAR